MSSRGLVFLFDILSLNIRKLTMKMLFTDKKLTKNYELRLKIYQRLKLKLDSFIENEEYLFLLLII